MTDAHAAAAIRRALDRYLLAVEGAQVRRGRAWGLSTTEMSAVQRIGYADGLTPNQLASDLQLSSGGATALVQRLEERGWIERSPHHTDRRSVVLRLTSSGRERLEATAAFHASIDAVTNGFAPDERDVVHRWLDAVGRAVQRLAEDASIAGSAESPMTRRLGPPSLWS